MLVVVPVRGRADHQAHGLPLADADGAGGGVVAGLAAVEPIAFLQKDAVQGLGGKAHVVEGFHIGNNVFPLPAEIQFDAHARMDAAVAHHDEHVVFLQFHPGLENLFASDDHFLAGEFVMSPIPQQDHPGVIILNDLRFLVVVQVR